MSVNNDNKFASTAGKIKDFYDKFPKIYNAYFVASISCISGMMFGVDISSISAFIGTEQYNNYFNTPSSAMQGFITSSMALGSFFGSIVSSWISEPLGRRASLTLCSLFWMIGAAIQSSVQNRAQLICGRFIAGFGIGFGSTVAPVYGSELSPRKIRGFIGGLFQFSVTLGILIMFYISYGLHFIDGTASFRIAWGIQIVFGIALFFGVFILPESPRWLARNNYWDEAEDVVERIQKRYAKKSTPPEEVEKEINVEISEIKEQLLVEKASENISYATLFNKHYRLRTLTAIAAQIWQQLTGINSLMYYVVILFNMSGYTGNANLVASSIQYVLNAAMTVPALFLLDKVGRRPVLMTGAILMMIFQFAIAGILATYSEPVDSVDGNPNIKITIPSSHKAAGKGVIAMCYLFVCSFACTWGVGIWLYCSEIWGDNRIRARGAALSTAANWIFNFTIGMYSPSSFQNITWKTYIIYAVFCLCMFIHVLLGFPETKGKRLEEIGEIWDEHIPAWKTKNWVPSLPLTAESMVEKKTSLQHVENETAPESSEDSSQSATNQNSNVNQA